MATGLFYEKPVLLDRAQHRRWRVRPSESFAFARNINSVFIAGSEFGEAAKEYPLVFSRLEGGQVVPLALLGLRRNENLFVQADGRWDAHYLPAYVRRYPFVLAEVAPGQMGVCLDEAYAGLSFSEGEPLFDEQGGDAPFLKNALDFLNQYQSDYLRTEAFCRQLVELDLLTEMTARADLNDGRSFNVAGLLVVNADRLNALTDEQVLHLARSGTLALIHLQQASLSNLNRLIDRMAARKSPLQAPPKPE